MSSGEHGAAGAVPDMPRPVRYAYGGGSEGGTSSVLVSLVPSTATRVLDIGCASGYLGRELDADPTVRGVGYRRGPRLGRGGPRGGLHRCALRRPGFATDAAVVGTVRRRTGGQYPRTPPEPRDPARPRSGLARARGSTRHRASQRGEPEGAAQHLARTLRLHGHGDLGPHASASVHVRLRSRTPHGQRVCRRRRAGRLARPSGVSSTVEHPGLGASRHSSRTRSSCRHSSARNRVLGSCEAARRGRVGIRGERGLTVLEGSKHCGKVMVTMDDAV